MLVWLSDVGKEHVSSVGGKGASLGEMLRAGIPLPPGFCLTARAYRHFARSAGLEGTLTDALAAPGIAEGEALACEAASSRIRAQLEAAAIPEDLAETIRAAYTRLGDQVRVAVRSSATAEDLPDASFAGQQETFLNVRGIDAVFAHLLRCWSSLWTARAISYRSRQGFDHREVALAVVLQVMIDAEVAGVLFTVNPVTGRSDELLINASWGLGEAVVSGMVTPDSFCIARRGFRLVRQAQVGSKERRIVPRPEGGTVTEEVPAGDRVRPSLDRGALRALRELGVRVEAHYGHPQDIEWAYARGSLYLLQARPVTTTGGLVPPKAFGRTHQAMVDDLLEHYPEPPTPLDHAAVTEGYEQLQHAMRDLGLRVQPADALIRMDADGISRIYPSLPRPGLSLLKLPWHLWTRLRSDARRWRLLDDDVHRIRQRLEQTPVSNLEVRALAEYIRTALDLAARVARSRFTDVITPMFLRGSWLRLLTRLAGHRLAQFEWLAGLSYRTVQVEAGLQALADTALATRDVLQVFQQAPPEHILGELQRTAAGREFLFRVEAFLKEHGARTSKLYLPFSTRSWREDRSALFVSLGAMIRSGTAGGADARAAAGMQRFEQLRAEVVATLPGFLHATFRRTVDAFREDHVGREETVYRIEEAFVFARRGVDEAAIRLIQAGTLLRREDVQFLRLEELLAALRGELETASLPRAIARRRSRRAAAVTTWKSQHVLPAASGGAALRGAAGSPGLATGPVRVVRDVADFGRLARGDVLVCPFTDPTWTPLFSLACAVVADTGGPLSHAAIVAREYGIPAVLGTKAATRELQDGEVVTVDGARGEVRRAAT